MAGLEHSHDSGCASWILIVVISWSTNFWPHGQVDTKLWCQSDCPKEAWIALEKHWHRGNLGDDEREKIESNGAMLIHKFSYITTRPCLTGKMFWYSDLQDLVVLEWKHFEKVLIYVRFLRSERSLPDLSEGTFCLQLWLHNSLNSVNLVQGWLNVTKNTFWPADFKAYAGWWEVKPTCQVAVINVDLEQTLLYSIWILPHLLSTCKWDFTYCPLSFTSRAFSFITHASGDSQWAWESRLIENVGLLRFSV